MNFWFAVSKFDVVANHSSQNKELSQLYILRHEKFQLDNAMFSKNVGNIMLNCKFI